MTVATESVLAGPFYPNGSTTAFPFNFRAISPDDVQFLRLDLDGNEFVFSTALYAVRLIGNGGSVIFAAPPAASLVPHFVKLDPSFLQEISFENEGAFLPEVVTEALDRAAMRALYLRDRTTRAFSVPPGDEGSQVPVRTARLGKLPVFDGAGDLTVLGDVSSVVTVDSLGRVSGTPIIDVLSNIGVSIVDDGAWGGAAQDDGVWG